jgi:L-fuconolactonase
MIDFPIVDTHLHLWDINNLSYPWLSDVPLLNRTFLPDDYDKACGGLKVEKMVFMQCECDTSQYKQEVAWVSELARKDTRLKGIVAWAPLENGEGARSEIEELKKNPLIKGIRRIIQFEPDLEFCLRAGFIEGVNLLPEYGLTFDICISHIHNKSLLRFLDKCPGVPMILDHIGKPDIRNKVLDPWRSEIREIAKFPNVYLKFSSLATEADHRNWTVEGLRPYADHVLECFGIDRTVFGSDWPVVTQAATIPAAIETMLEIMKGCSPEDLKKVFYENGKNFYKL